MNLWIDVALMASLFAIGNILFGHFEERTPKWRRVLKFFVMTAAVTLISATAGRGWSAALIGALSSLTTRRPRRHGVSSRTWLDSTGPSEAAGAINAAPSAPPAATAAPPSSFLRVIGVPASSTICATSSCSSGCDSG